MIVIDASITTAEPSGADIDGDGQIDESARPPPFARDRSPDSFLAAQVVAARTIVASRSDSSRLALIAARGEGSGGSVGTRARRVTPLTLDGSTLERGLSRILSEGPGGRARFSPAMELAIRELDRADAAPTRLVLFVADMHSPVIEVTPRGVLRGDPDAKDLVIEAGKLGIRFHTFGLREAAEKPPPHLLSRIADGTGGRYYAVPAAERPHCSLAAALTDHP